MREIDSIQLLADLTEEHCQLCHGPQDDPQSHPAVDYLVLPMGRRQDAVRETIDRELVIPVCHECIEALRGDEWTLLFCFECSHNRWVYRDWAKNNYRHHILWLRGCPDCTNEFGGLYFNDIQEMAGPIDFVSNHIQLRAI